MSYENIVLEVGTSWKTTSLDWTMMAIAVSAEHIKTEWRELLSSVGLQIQGIWMRDPACESLKEAVPAVTTKL